MEMNTTPSRTRKVTFLNQEDNGIDPIGIASKAVNIDGIPLLPRRGKFIKDANVESKADVGNKLQVSKSDSVSLDNKMVKATYADSVQLGTFGKPINFRFLESVDMEKGVDVVLSRESGDLG
ncbi:hypothetical protein QVD17_00211 [Tagetes erecta]|uniref:Uncharacterized protein n=1 Tax=Tagetes erecta TaxID=13708 RepID=A0AAD8L7F7_TARER|nr:hypothetical protein QVD17_00211 [Tagetes erecta]